MQHAMGGVQPAPRGCVAQPFVRSGGELAKTAAPWIPGFDDAEARRNRGTMVAGVVIEFSRLLRDGDRLRTIA
jgi:hypothetical protein